MKKTITKFFALMGFAGTVQAQTFVDTFESYTLTPNSYYQNNNGNDWTANQNYTTFRYGWNTSFGGYWESGSSYTNVQDTTNGDFSNLYGAASYSAHSGSNYVTVQNGAMVVANTSGVVAGFYVTNTTYAYKSIKNGDMFARKFGDTTNTYSGGLYAQGEYPDWFTLTVNGYQNGAITNSVVVYLADYRATGTANDFALNTWQYVNCLSLGTVDSLSFVLNSSDSGQFGMNTPGFFALDDFDVNYTVGVKELQSISGISTFPNPAKEFMNVNFTSTTNELYEVVITDVKGNTVFENNIQSQIGKNNMQVNTSSFDAGIYFMQLSNGTQIKNTKFIKH